MSINNCILIAIEGSHSSGKSTLVHSLIAHYKRRGTLVECIGEPARTSPFVEDIVIHKKGAFDIFTEVDLFAAQLTTQIRATRYQKLLICDKTIINVLAYARLFISQNASSTESSILEAMQVFCKAWSNIYDLVFYCQDFYSGDYDPYRQKVLELSAQTDENIREAFNQAGVSLLKIPRGLETEKRVDWVVERVNPLLGGRVESV